MINEGDIFEYEFSHSQEDVNTFAKISGDNNPVHLDQGYAAGTVYKKPIIHGFFGASVFSKIFGALWPGEGTVYLNQTINFKRPMYPDVLYKAQLKVKEVDKGKHRSLVETKIVEVENNKPVITGEANIMNKEKIKHSS